MSILTITCIYYYRYAILSWDLLAAVHGKIWWQPLIDLIEDRTHKLLQLVIYRIPDHLAHRFLGVSAVISTHTMLVFCYGDFRLQILVVSCHQWEYGSMGWSWRIQFNLVFCAINHHCYCLIARLASSYTLDNITRWWPEESCRQYLCW